MNEWICETEKVILNVKGDLNFYLTHPSSSSYLLDNSKPSWAAGHILLSPYLLTRDNIEIEIENIKLKPKLMCADTDYYLNHQEYL